MRGAAEIERALAEVGTAERAAGTRRYLKSAMRHLGASVPQIRKEAKGAAAEVGSRRELRALAEELWAEPVFERRACAAFLLDYRVDLLGPADVPAIRRYVASSRTWALVDPLSVDVLGHLLSAHPEVAARLDPWTRDRDFWVRRAALLSQIRPLKAGADFDRFARWADPMLEEREFFVGKAIGWVLRETAKTRGAEVYEWLLPRAPRASAVTIREAVKYLAPDQREAILAARVRR
ncbi:MAG TPA: DNA alkylation repair protein [Solirubrobacterales bacterium]|nr:DNA alkylation repair protein [Solirubrobacterales bacterium]HWB69267.1 DNA alkylation repair protein [Solirubrobacterales bacterium]